MHVYVKYGLVVFVRSQFSRLKYALKLLEISKNFLFFLIPLTGRFIVLIQNQLAKIVSFYQI